MMKPSNWPLLPDTLRDRVWRSLEDSSDLSHDDLRAAVEGAHVAFAAWPDGDEGWYLLTLKGTWADVMMGRSVLAFACCCRGCAMKAPAAFGLTLTPQAS